MTAAVPPAETWPRPSLSDGEDGGGILFDNGVTRVALRSRRVQGTPLAVVFNHLNANDVNRTFYAEDLFWRDGMDVLAVKSRRNHWFQDVDPAALAKAIAPFGYEDVYTFGASMGGYGALFFSHAVKARRAILFSPQYSVDPAFTPWERRWSSEIVDAVMRHERVETTLSPTCEYLLIFDSKERSDRRHATMIEQAAATAGAHLRKLPMPGATHEAISAVNETGLLSDLVLGLVDRRSGVEGVLHEVNRRRRQSFQYAYSLGRRAWARSPQIRRKIALEAERRAKNLWHRTLLAELADSQGWVEPVDRLQAEVAMLELSGNPDSDIMLKHARETLRRLRPCLEDLPPLEVIHRLGILDRLLPRASVLIVADRPTPLAKAVAERGCSVTVATSRVSGEGLPLAELQPAAFNAGLSFLVAERLDDVELTDQLAALLKSLKTGAVLAVHYAVGHGVDDQGAYRRTREQFASLVEASGGRVINTLVLSSWQVAHLVRTTRAAPATAPSPARVAEPKAKPKKFRLW